MPARLKSSELRHCDRGHGIAAVTPEPLQHLHEALETGRLKPGMKCAAVAFGSGFTWGAVLIDF